MEVIITAKKIKVRLIGPKTKGGVNSYFYQGKRYKPGDIFHVEKRHFRSDFMESLEPGAAKKPIPIPKPAEGEEVATFTVEPTEGAAAEKAKGKDVTAEKSAEKKGEKP